MPLPLPIVESVDAADLTEAGHRLAPLAALIMERREGFDPSNVFLAWIRRGHQRSTLVLDGGWIDLLRHTDLHNPDLLDGLGIPPSALAAIVPGWPGEFGDLVFDAESWIHRPDGVLISVDRSEEPRPR